MGFRDLSICISSLESDYGLIDQASAIAEAWEAHLSCCAIGAQPAPFFSDGMMLGGQVEFQAQMDAARETIQAFRSRLRQHLEKKASSLEIRETLTFDSALAGTVAVFARYSDLVIARMPAKPDRDHHGEIIEGALFGAGRPVLVLPKKWKSAPLGKKVMLAWDASREASRAIHDALPMLAPGAEVCVVTVDAQVGPDQHGASPGLDISTHLARHGLKMTVQNADSLGKPVGERLVEAAQGFGADLIVMGGYRHPKLAQRILGGPSHFLISKSPLPVLLSH
jgi:nucleotide-binding universal stress UspA family protein